MRIAVVSDIHGNLPALQAVVADLGRRGADVVVNLGDSLSGPLLPLETAQFLMVQPWVHLAGNHERQVLQLSANADTNTNAGLSDRYAHSVLGPSELRWMASLDHTRWFNDEVLLCHGAPGKDTGALLQTAERPATAEEVEQRLHSHEAALILCGHSHVPRCVRTRRGGLVLNPGSVGLQAYRDDHPYPHVIATGSPDARYAIVERGAYGWCAELFTVPYAHGQMAELARLRQSLDWEQALLTGYLP